MLSSDSSEYGKDFGYLVNVYKPFDFWQSSCNTIVQSRLGIRVEDASFAVYIHIYMYLKLCTR